MTTLQAFLLWFIINELVAIALIEIAVKRGRA